MKNIKLLLTIGFSSLFLSSCASYNEIVPSWAEICSKPVDKSKATNPPQLCPITIGVCIFNALKTSIQKLLWSLIDSTIGPDV